MRASRKPPATATRRWTSSTRPRSCPTACPSTGRRRSSGRRSPWAASSLTTITAPRRAAPSSRLRTCRDGDRQPGCSLSRDTRAEGHPPPGTAHDGTRRMRFETLASGYGLIEGPRVDATGALYFSDVTNGGVYRRRPDGSIDTVVPRRRGVGGIALHADGGLVISGKNVCHVKDGTTRVLFTRDDAPGFNDMFTDEQGRVYTGTMKSDPFKLEGERVAGECWRIDAE